MYVDVLINCNEKRARCQSCNRNQEVVFLVMNFIILLVIMTTISSLVKASIVEIGSVKSEFGGQ